MMTTTTRRALYRVRNVARRMVSATDALRPVDLRAMPVMVRMTVGGAARACRTVAQQLTRILDDGATATEIATDGDDA